MIASNHPLGSRECARQLAIEPARANRLLRSLALSGVLTQDEHRKYRAGPGLHVLSAQAMRASGLLPAALPAIESLRDTGLIVALGVLWRDQVSYLIHGRATKKLEEGIGRVGTYPASRSGIGMALLARQTDDIVRSLYATAPDIPGFPGGIRELLAELRRTRSRPYATAFQSVKQDREIWSIGVALPHVPEAALALSGPIAPEQHAELAARLVAAANQINPSKYLEEDR